ncbi:hypothetical protein Tco_0898990, partial [Tanacetum coccineum]
NTMAEQNVPAQPPTRTDEQIVPRSQWLTIGKSNLLFNAQKIQKNPIIQYQNCLQYTVNYVYQPWRAILSLLNQCLTGKTSGSDKPRHPVLQMLWGIVTQTNVDHAELIWEEFTQGIPDNFSHKSQSESVEVFGMAIPDPLITEAIQQSSYYPKYLEMVAKNTKKTSQESASVQSATKRATPKKPTTTTPVKQTKPAPPPTKKLSKRKLPQKVRKGKPAFQLVDEEDEAQQESIPQREDDDPDLELAKKLSLETPQEKGEGEGDDADLERAIKLSLDPAFLPQGRAPVGGVTIRDPVRDQTPPDSTTGPSSQPEDDTSEKVIHESSSTSDSERTESDTETGAPKGDKVQDPEPMNEDQTGSDSRKLHVSLAGPNPEHMDDEFLATAYPKVHENLKLITDERVIDDKPESHSGSMSSMKNLDDTFNFGDQFLHDKPTEDDQEKSKVREESDSTIPDSSHQTVTSTPPVIAPFTEVSSSKPSLLVTPPPINTEATTITTSLPEITPFIALQLRVARLEQEMSEVKKTDHSADVLASIRSQVPTAVDKYLGSKLDDALLKVLERHTADLIEKYSVLPGPETIQNQESEKSPKEIIKAKKEQGEEKQDSTYSIRSTDKVDLEEFDLKNEDDDDDEGPSADKPGDERHSATPNITSALTQQEWQITDTREAGVDSSMHKSDPNQTLYVRKRSENQANLHAGQQESNQNTGTKDKIDAGDSEKEDESDQDSYF